MAVREFSYKGKDVSIDQPDDQHAEVKIDDRTFGFSLHGEPLPMWMCDEAYFGAPELDEVIRHLVDYWHVVTDDDNKPPPIDAHGEGHGGGKSKAKAKTKGKSTRRSTGKSKHDH